MNRKVKMSGTKSKSPFDYQYDQSGYIVMGRGVRREAATGRLVIKDKPKGK